MLRLANFLRMSSALAAVVFLATACPPPQNNDAGVDAGDVVDDAGPDPEVDSGPDPIVKRQEGQSCVVANNECDENLICIPNPLNPTAGVCRIECALLDDQGAATGGDPAKCPDPQSPCQLVIDANLNPVALACVPQSQARDQSCGTPDEIFGVEGVAGSCGNDLSCYISDFTVVGEDITVNVATCQDACADDAECPAGEFCADSKMPFLDVQRDPAAPDATIACNKAVCDEGGAGCECDLAAGYGCLELSAGPACAKAFGMCATPIGYLNNDDLNGGGIGPDLVCDDVTGHAFCDTRAYSELTDGAQGFCLNGVFGDGSNQGLCIAFCKQFAFDYDGNGQVDADSGEGAVDLACAANEVCDLNFGTVLGLGSVEEDANGEAVACDPTVCLPGEPCETPCTKAGAQCITFGEGADAQSFCGVPFGLCQPAPAEQPQ